MRSWERRAAGLVLTAGLGCLVSAAPALADDLTPPKDSTPVVGMAYGKGTSSLWLAGPKANRGIIVNDKGRQVSLGVKPRSVQALAWWGDRLWIGDIGDPDSSRERIVVYRLSPTEEGRGSHQAYDFAYEDGPRDAKAMMVSARGRIYIATAGRNPGIYRAEQKPSRGRVNKLTRVADAPAGVTDGVFLSEGDMVALRTSTGIEYYDPYTWKKEITHTLVGAPGSESVAINADDEVLVGGNPRIRVMAVPSSDTKTTVTTPKPKQSASAPAGARPAAPAEPKSSGGDPNFTGTFIAVGLAGFVALIAGVITFFVRPTGDRPPLS